MKYFFLFLFATLAFMLLPVISVFAPPPLPPPVGIPLDGGVLSLIIGGILITIRKLFQHFKEKK